MFNKVSVFKEELSWITDETIRTATEKVIDELPDYFFDTAASSTGKYHPSYALGNGGLVRHTKAAVRICKDLSELLYNTQRFSQTERDLMLAALILHDGMKHGLEGSEYTVAEHPIVMSRYIVSNHTEDYGVDNVMLLADLISSHMGQWNTDYRTKEEILPVPKTEMQYFVHLCDYLASRKYLTVEFEDYYNPSEYKGEDKLTAKINEIIRLCKEKIADNGISRDKLYDIIAAENGGKKNPKSITDISVAERIINAISLSEKE